MSAFKTVAKGKLGYSQVEVDSFIERARDQYNNVSAQLLDWRDITAQQFPLVKGGYDVIAVDNAIDKLQDSFAERELKRKVDPYAPSLSGSLLAELRILLLGRASRAKNKRFSRSGVLAIGYSRKEVDALLSIVEEFLNGEEELTLSEVRTLSFKVKRGGYIESQVDAYIERLVEFLQTQRFSEPVAVSPIASSGSFESGSGESYSPYSEY